MYRTARQYLCGRGYRCKIIGKHKENSQMKQAGRGMHRTARLMKETVSNKFIEAYKPRTFYDE